jgi:hypothetical protein
MSGAYRSSGPGRAALAVVAAALLLLLIPACSREVAGRGAAAPAGGLPTGLATEPGDPGTAGSGPAGTEPTGTAPTDPGPTDPGPTDSGPTYSGPTDSGPTDTGPPPSESPSPTAGPSSGGSGRPCPAEGSGGVPGGTAATFVVGYQTPTFRLFFCRGTDHRLYYHGVSRADPASAVTLPAGAVPNGYQASTRGDDGHTYLYRVADGRLIIARDGMVLRDEPLTPL